NRSVGGSLHVLNYGATTEDYFRQPDQEILVIIQAEHIAAAEIADELYAVPGVDAVFVRPSSLATSLRKPDGTPPSKQLMEETLTRIREAAQRQKLPCGLHVQTAADAQRRIAEGWQFIAIASELKMMLESANNIAKQVCGEKPAASLANY